MSLRTPFTRRHLIGGLGAAGVATAGGIGLAGSAVAAPGDQNDGLASGPSASPTATPARTEDLVNPVVQSLGAIDFQPANFPAGLVYVYVVPGGVRVTAQGAFFNCGLRLPVGATIMGAKVFVNPNGGGVNAAIERYDPLAATFEDLIFASSTNGSVPETINLPLTHVVQAGWNYRIDNVFLTSGATGATLYGAEVTYTIPPDPAPPAPPAPPTGLFTPFVGPPRVYDSRTSGVKLAASEERIITLGVPGTVKAAIFNLTVTETVGAGFAACFRADIAWPVNSSINWYEAGANTANLVICAVDAAGRIKVRGGANSTHFIIDMIGTFV
jgi:hypothetical protein